MSPDPTKEEQTPAQKEEIEQTPAQKEEKKEELFPKAEVTRMLKKQAAELTAKYKPFEEKAAKLDEIEQAGKTELEKLTGKVSKLEKEIADKDGILSAKDLKLTKILTLLKAGATIDPEHPEQLDDLVDRIRGSTPEEIVSDVEKMKSWGWIGQKQPTETKPAGIGTPTKSGEPDKPKATLKEQIAEVTEKLKDPKLSQVEKQRLAALSISLTNRSIRGEV